jgi:2-dehydropantoate 2-reductase
VLDALAQQGLLLTDLDGGQRRLLPFSLQLFDRVPEGVHPALVLLTVKSGATAQAAAELDLALPPRTPVLSLQNGIQNAAIAQRAAPTLHVLPGMVPYNVAELGPGHFHRGTTGRLAARQDMALRTWVSVFEQAGVGIDLHADLLPVQWGKLLLNLNNPVNALSGLPLREQLLDAGYRRCLAALMDEALEALEWARIKPAQLAAVPPRRMPAILRLPTPVFRLVAARMLRIDAKARSSMADDLALGRPTEIDALCGEVVRLARSNGARAPLSAKMVELIEAWPQRPQHLSAPELLAALGVK